MESVKVMKMENVTKFLETGDGGSRGFAERVCEIILMFVILAVSLLGNLCVLILILRHKNLKKLSFIFIFNLSMTDLGLSLICVPISMTVLYNDKFIFSKIVCDMLGTIMLVFGISSLLTLVAISVTRYASVCQPTYARTHFTKAFYIGSTLLIWLVSFLIAFPPLVGWGRIEFNYGYTVCTLNWPSSISYTLFIMTLSIFLPFGIIVLCYGMLFYSVWKSKRRVRGNSQQNSIKRSDLKLAKVSLSVFVSFMICWIPVSVINFLLLAGYHVPDSWSMFAIVCMYLNSLCNPVIYPLMSADFRQGFKGMFCPCLKSAPQPTTTVFTMN